MIRRVYGTILELIGNTPLVRLNNFVKKKDVEILLKLEGFNPQGSIKDRIALHMIEQAERSRILTRDKVLIEATSGNTGIGLAMVSAVKGYQLTIVMSSGVSIERRKVLRALGAKIILTPAEEGTDGAIRKVASLLKHFPDKYVHLDQYSNPDNPATHEEITALEIAKQTNYKVDYLVASIGTSGTLMGLSRGLKTKIPNVKIIGVHPLEGHHIQGLKNMKESIIPDIYDASLIDDIIEVKDEDAFKTARMLAQLEGILAGMSSGAALFAALKLSEQIMSGRIIVILPDRGEKYLSTTLFSD